MSIKPGMRTRLQLALSSLALLMVFMQSALACPNGGTSAQENLGRLLLKNNYSYINCQYLGMPYNYANLQAHAGVDYPAHRGTPIYAPLSGRLHQSGTVADGYSVYYDLGGGKKFFIHHIRNFKTGWVNKGDKIAEIYQAHVHAELRINYFSNQLLGGLSCGGTCTYRQVAQKTADPASVIPVAKQLRSLRLFCPSSVNEDRRYAGLCNARAYYADGSNQTVTPSWSDNSSALRIYSTGALRSYAVSSDTRVTVTGSYREGNVIRRARAVIIVKDVPSTSAMRVTSVSPQTVIYGRRTTFTVRGSGLPSRLAVWIDECVGATYSTGNATTHTFSCTPRYSKGTKSGVIKDQSRGITLYNFRVRVR